MCDVCVYHEFSCARGKNYIMLCNSLLSVLTAMFQSENGINGLLCSALNPQIPLPVEQQIRFKFSVVNN